MFAAVGPLPVYAIAGRVDNCNFSTQTVWEGSLRDGAPFVFDASRPPGRQYVADATDLSAIDDERYDFFLSCHALEHVANPLKALAEWQRVLRPGGTLLLVLPHKAGTFDHRRPTTTLAHLIDDHRADVGPDDLTHVDESARFHDARLSPPQGNCDAESFRALLMNNKVHRLLHHHTFDLDLTLRMLDHAGFRLIDANVRYPFHIVVLAERPHENAPRDGAALLSGKHPAWRTSPFACDRIHAG